MGIYIKGMEMPSGCLDCPLYNGYGCKATLQMFHPTTNVAVRVDSCPLTETQNGEWIDKGWHGDWQFETDGRGNCWKVFECSNCNCPARCITPFCPQCGARMKEADDE